MAGGVLRVTLSGFIFVVTGLVQTVCVQALLYSGGGDRSTLLIALPNYAGIFLVYVIGQHAFRALDSLGVWEARGADRNRVHVPLYGKDGGIGERSNMKRVAVPFTLQSLRDGLAKFFHPERRKLFILAFNELGGFITGIIGLSIAGSGLYQVVFSGGTVFTALLSVFFLRRRLALSQWVFVAVITLGLTVTAEQVTHPSNSHTGEDANAASIISGVSFVLVSCLFYSTNYVIAEHFLDVREQVETDLDEAPPELPPPSGVDLSLYTGGTCLFIFGLYVLLHTVPHWHELVTLSIERHRGNAAIIVEQYCYLAIAAFLHGITYYDIVATVGAVPIGVLNAVRAVSVFAVSSILFCEHQTSQCYSSRKGISTGIVIFGAVGYSMATAFKERFSSGTSGDRRSKSRRVISGELHRSSSAPFLLASGAGSSGSWFGFGRRQKQADG